jgi:hypothetical protein
MEALIFPFGTKRVSLLTSAVTEGVHGTNAQGDDAIGGYLRT